MINIAILDDDEKYLSDLKEFFTENNVGINCLLTTKNTKELVLWLTEHESPAVDIVLVDMNLVTELGSDVILFLADQFPTIEYIVLSAMEDQSLLLKSLTAGASGYLLKDQSFDEIAKNIKISAEGGAAISSLMARKLIGHFKSEKATKSSLSLKAKKVLHYLAEGWSYKMIADNMGVSIDGVRFHIKEIYRTLKVQSRTQAIRKYLDGNY